MTGVPVAAVPGGGAMRISVSLLLLQCAGASWAGADTAAAIVDIHPYEIAAAARAPIRGSEFMHILGEGAPTVASVTRFESADRRFAVDVSDYDRVELTLRNWPVDEVMVLLDGKLEIVDENRRSQHYGRGDAFLMPRGFSGTWRQRTPVRKIAVSYQTSATDPVSKTAPLVSIVSAAGPLWRESQSHERTLSNGLHLAVAKGGRYEEVSLYRSPDSHLQVTADRFEALDIQLEDWPADEFIWVRKGHAELTRADGTVSMHGPGSSFVLPRGFSGRWYQRDALEIVTVQYGEGS